MKKLTIPTTPKEIDWSKPQWVINIDHDSIVLTNGINEGPLFSGTALPCDLTPNGEYSEFWCKYRFIPLTFDIPFTISNED